MTHSEFSVYLDIIKKYYDELDEINKKEFGGKALRFRNGRMWLAYYFYESYRKTVRKLYMGQEENPMDRHKIASIMMISLLKARPIKVNRRIGRLSLPLLLANEFLAFYCGLNVVELYKSDQLGTEYSLILPPTYIEGEGDTSYIENVCKALFYSRRFSVNDVFSYANIYFLLEKYTNTKTGLDKDDSHASDT